MYKVSSEEKKWDVENPHRTFTSTTCLYLNLRCLDFNLVRTLQMSQRQSDRILCNFFNIFFSWYGLSSDGQEWHEGSSSNENHDLMVLCLSSLVRTKYRLGTIAHKNLFLVDREVFPKVMVFG